MEKWGKKKCLVVNYITIYEKKEEYGTRELNFLLNFFEQRRIVPSRRGPEEASQAVSSLRTTYQEARCPLAGGQGSRSHQRKPSLSG